MALKILPLPLFESVGLVPLSECVQQGRCLLGEAGRLWQHRKDRADGLDGRPVIGTINVVLERVHGAVSRSGLCGLIDTANSCRCKGQVASGLAAGFLNPEHLPFANHPRIPDNTTFARAVNELGDLVAIGSVYRYDRFRCSSLGTGPYHRIDIRTP